MAEQKGNGSEHPITAPPKVRTVSRSTAITALAICFVAGYALVQQVTQDRSRKYVCGLTMWTASLEGRRR